MLNYEFFGRGEPKDDAALVCDHERLSRRNSVPVIDYGPSCLNVMEHGWLVVHPLIGSNVLVDNNGENEEYKEQLVASSVSRPRTHTRLAKYLPVS